MVSPAANRSTTDWTVTRVPSINGFPNMIFGSTLIARIGSMKRPLALPYSTTFRAGETRVQAVEEDHDESLHLAYGIDLLQ